MPLLTAVGVLARNPELLKCVIAAGLQSASSSVAIALVTSDLKARYWGNSMTQIQAMYSMVMAIVAVLGSGYYGRFSDSFDRRYSAGLYGLLTFLPSWAFLVFGLTRTGLCASQIFSVISCVGVSSNVLLVLSHDVTPPKDRELAFGSYYMAVNFVSFIFLGIPILLILVLGVVPDNPYVALWYQVFLSTGFFVMLFSVGQPIFSCCCPTPELAWEGEQEALEEEEEDDDDEEEDEGGPLSKLFAPLMLGCMDPVIRNLCMTATLVAFSGDLVMDIGGQYFRDELGLLPFGSTQEQQDVSVLSSLPPQLLILPGYAGAGFLMNALGSLKLLKILIPVSAALTAFGAAFHLLPSFWTLPVTVVALSYSSLATVPLQHLVTVAAPKGRVGEAMGAVGACQQIANFIGNFITATLNPLLFQYMGNDPLWVYYPSCGFLTLLAILPASRIRANEGKEGDTEVDDEKMS